MIRVYRLTNIDNIPFIILNGITGKNSSKVNLDFVSIWTAIKSRYWGGEENLNLKRKKQAELLVFGDIPPEVISVFACYDEDSKEELIQMGVDSEKIKIVPKAYF